MTQAKADGDEIMYMDEIHGEASRPLTSIDADAVPFVGLRAGFGVETENGNDPQPISGPGNDNDRVDGKPQIGFDSGDLGNGLLPGRPFSPSNDGSRDLFPSQAPSEVTPDVNVYQHKKTIAQGMMDLALLSANANQMRYVLQTDAQHPYYYPALTMISMSLLLQIAVGIGLIWNSRYNIKEHAQMCKANKANNWTVIGIFLVTIFNVFISSFGVVDVVQTSAVAT